MAEGQAGRKSGAAKRDFAAGDAPNRVERKLIEAVEAGERLEVDAELVAGADGFIRAGLIRAILIGVPVAGLPLFHEDGTPSRATGPRAVRLTPAGLRIRPAVHPRTSEDAARMPRLPVRGRFDLAGLSGPAGTPLPALQMSACRFEGAIDLSAAHLGGLSLVGSRFSFIEARGVIVHGTLRLAWCGPIGEAAEVQQQFFPFRGRRFEIRDGRYAALPDGEEEASGEAGERAAADLPDEAPIAFCAIDFASAQIHGWAIISCCDFGRGRDDEAPYASGEDKPHSTVSFVSADIRDSLLVDQCVVVGGLSLKGCDVREDVWLRANRLFAYDGDDAATIQSAKIGGILVFNGLPADGKEGRAAFFDQIVLGSVQAIGLRAQEIWIESGVFIGSGLTFAKADIELSFVIGNYAGGAAGSPVVIDAALDLSHANVGKTIDISGVRSDRSLIDPAGRLGGGRLRVATFAEPTFQLNAAGVRVDRRMQIVECALAGTPQTWRVAGKPGRWTALDLSKATIGTGLRIDSKTTVAGIIVGDSAVIGREAVVECREITGTPIAPPGARPGGVQFPVCLRLQEAAIDGPLRLTGSLLRGGVSLQGARIAGGLELDHLSFDLGTLNYRQDETGVDLRSSQARTVLNLRDCRCEGELRVEHLAWLPYNAGPPVSAARALEQAAEQGRTSLAILAATSKEGWRDPVSVRELPFYRDCLLVEIDEGARYERLLHDARNGRTVMLLNGFSLPIHAFNHGGVDGERRLELDDADKRRAYVAFFCDAMAASEGIFTILTSVRGRDVPFVELAEPAEPAEPAEAGGADGAAEGAEGDVPAQPVPQPWHYKATLLYGSMLFEAELRLWPDGRVEMVNDDNIEKNVPIGTSDRYPRRPKPDAVNPEMRRWDYAGEPVDEKRRAATLAAIEAELAGDAAARWIAALKIAARGRRRAKLIDNNDAMTAKDVAVVDLEGLAIGALSDGHGTGWGFSPDDPDESLPAWLKAAGIKCSRVEPSAQSPTGGTGNASGAFQSAGRGTGHAADLRLEWLHYQWSVQASGEGDGGRLRTLLRRYLRLWDRLKCADERDFVPQTFDEFASAHFRAGEPEQGQAIIVAKKDMHNALQFQTAWRRRFKPEDGPKRGVWVLAVGTAAALLWILGVGVGFLPGVAGIAVAAVAFAAISYALWPYLLGLAQLLFKIFFRYGLSPSRALATFAGLLIVGWVGTHVARTGGIDPTPDWSALTRAGLDEDIALVLNVDYDPERADTSSAEAGPLAALQAARLTLPQQPGQQQALWQEGVAIYAAPAPCNLGVSSFVYAADLFIPIVDLDQSHRCTVRPDVPATAENASMTSYNGWRLGKALYEVLGWIVTSLTILTITGVMKRDLER